MLNIQNMEKIQSQEEELKKLISTNKSIIVHIIDTNIFQSISNLFVNYFNDINVENTLHYSFINIDTPKELDIKYEFLEPKDIIEKEDYSKSNVLFAKSFNLNTNIEISLIKFSILLDNKEKGVLFVNSKLIDKNFFNLENPLIERLFPICEILIDDENKIRTIIKHTKTKK